MVVMPFEVMRGHRALTERNLRKCWLVLVLGVTTLLIVAWLAYDYAGPDACLDAGGLYDGAKHVCER